MIARGAPMHRPGIVQPTLSDKLMVAPGVPFIALSSPNFSCRYMSGRRRGGLICRYEEGGVDTDLCEEGGDDGGDDDDELGKDWARRGWRTADVRIA